MRPFRHAYLNWFWGSYTPVYLGVAQAAFDELRRVVGARQPEGYASRSPTTPTCAATSPR